MGALAEIIRSVALLVLLSLRGSHALPRCYSNKAHFVQHLQGTLGYSGEKGQQCGTPGKYSGGSCITDTVVFKTAECELEEYSAERLVHLLANRTLWLWGDSFSQQLHKVLTDCSVLQGTEIREAASEDRKCCSAATCLNFGGSDARICVVRADNALFTSTNKRCLKCVRDRDIMFLNIGLHFNDRKEYAKEMKSGVSELKKMMKRIHIVWRTNPPQHFDKPGGNFYKGARNFGKRCSTEGGLKAMRSKEWRNAVSVPYLRGAGIPILHIWDTALDYPSLHPGKVGGKIDCLHWCEHSGSVLRVWNSMMLNFIAGADELCGDQLYHNCDHLR